MITQEIVSSLENSGFKLAIAESLTGGQLCSDLVSVAGASKVILGSIVAYQTRLKSASLGVSSELLAKQGAVDPEVALRMAEGVRSRVALQLMLPTDTVIGISTTGVAGPDEQDGKPVGLVFIGISGARGDKVWEERFTGDRNAIRRQATDKALEYLREYLAA